MSSLPNLIQIIKQAAVEAVQASSPTSVLFGTVTKASPISIKIEQKFTLTSEFLILTNNVKRYTTTLRIDDELKTVTVDNSLSVGDKVILLQEQGGQKFIVLDKVGG